MSDTSTSDTRHDETIIGNLAREPELRYTRSGLAVANLVVAVDAPQRGGGEPTFRKVTVWRELAENTVLSLSKGDRVVVSGPTGTDTWTDAQGQAHAEDVITARAVGPDLRYATASPARMERRFTVEQEQEPVLDVEPAADEEADEEAMVQGQGL